MDFGDDLIKKFIRSISNLSYHEAAEGKQYFRETAEREESRAAFAAFKAQMVAKYGKQATLTVMNSTPHLLYSETQDLK